MSTSPMGSRVRIGDAERDTAASELGEHFAAGRLTREEFDERLGRAWAAKTRDDLEPLFLDLPSGGDRRQEVGGPRRDPSLRRAGWGTVGPRRRTPFGLPPPIAIVLAVVLMITIVTHLPFILFGLGVLWFFGMIGHRRSYPGRWAAPR
jgi:hypothetical protein